jgi:hypothetical protein
MNRPQFTRSYDDLLLLFTMAGVDWEESRRLAREFAAKDSVPEHEQETQEIAA